MLRNWTSRLSPQVDFEESLAENRFTVLPNIDPEIDSSECWALGTGALVGLSASQCVHLGTGHQDLETGFQPEQRSFFVVVFETEHRLASCSTG